MEHCRYKDKNGVCQHREGLFYGLADLCRFCEAGKPHKPSECSHYYLEEDMFGGEHPACYRGMPDSKGSCDGVCEFFHKEGEPW